MKTIYLLLLTALIPATLLWTSCNGDADNNGNSDSTEVTAEINHTQLLLDEIVKNGDFINSKKVPTMIKATDVHDNMNNLLIIDLRSGKAFSEGHIKNALNLKFNGLLDYMNNNNVTIYEKVVLVCYSGQTASYGASVLQMLGFDNVYAMKWGMSAWNSKTSGKWLNSISDKYADQLQTESNPKGVKGDLPKFDCGKATGKDIIQSRASKLFKDGFKPVLITSQEVFSNPADYYIINYWPNSLYALGHLPGAIQYNPKKSLNKDVDLLTLPTDKTIVTYCFTGQHSAFVTAYLRMLGYDARSLKYGANSFMNTTMKENKDIGHGFSKKQVHEYELETSEYVSDGAEESGGC